MLAQNAPIDHSGPWVTWTSRSRAQRATISGWWLCLLGKEVPVMPMSILRLALPTLPILSPMPAMDWPMDWPPMVWPIKGMDWPIMRPGPFGSTEVPGPPMPNGWLRSGFDSIAFPLHRRSRRSRPTGPCTSRHGTCDRKGVQNNEVWFIPWLLCRRHASRGKPLA